MTASGVLVFAETGQQGLTRFTRETLHAGRAVADALGEPLTAVVAVESDSPAAKEGISLGADIVRLVKLPDREYWLSDFVLTSLEAVSQRDKPRAVILAHSALGCDVAPRLAWRLNTYVGSGCVALRVDGKSIVYTRVEMGGKVLVEERCERMPVVLTLRPGVWRPAVAEPSRSGRVDSLELNIASLRSSVRRLRHVPQERGIIEQLKEAEVVVGGGKGMGGPEGFSTLQQLAGIMGGCVGASKAAIDRGWLAPDFQVGMTGTTIAPRVYVAVGISGASQHLMGCARAGAIIAINTDAGAPIFKYSHYGIVADWQKVISELIEMLREGKSNRD